MNRYRIKNWSEFQHYKDRNPPWIKLHYELLSSKDWVTLEDASRVLAVACMLLASRNDGYVPDDLDYLQRVAYLNSKPNLSPLVKCGFIELLADASTLHTNAIPETETETYSKEVDTDTKAKRVVAYPPKFETFWQTYPNRTGKAAAYKAYQLAIKQHGVTHEQLIDRAGQFAAAHAKAGTPSQYIPHPATWLNQGRWEDDISRITARSNGAPPAANARGSQFNAVQSALAELIAEDQQDVSHRQAGLPKRGMGSPFDIQLTREPEPKRLQIPADRDNTAGREIIDHDAAIPDHE